MKPKSRLSDRVDVLPSLTWWIMGTLAIILLWVKCSSGAAVGPDGYGWYRIAPVKRTNERGVLGEIVERSYNSQTYYDSDKGGYAHEGAHGLNSEIRNAALRRSKQESAYMPGGFALILPYTGIPLPSLVPRGTPGINVDARWSDGVAVDAVSIIDEYSAYVCGTIARVQNNQWNSRPGAMSIVQGSYDRYLSCENQVKRLRDASAQRGYPHAHRFDELIRVGQYHVSQWVVRGTP